MLTVIAPEYMSFTSFSILDVEFRLLISYSCSRFRIKSPGLTVAIKNLTVFSSFLQRFAIWTFLSRKDIYTGTSNPKQNSKQTNKQQQHDHLHYVDNMKCCESQVFLSFAVVFVSISQSTTRISFFKYMPHGGAGVSRSQVCLFINKSLLGSPESPVFLEKIPLKSQVTSSRFWTFSSTEERFRLAGLYRFLMQLFTRDRYVRWVKQ